MSYSYEQREDFLIHAGMSEEQIFQDDFGREYYYELDEGIKEKVYLEDVIREDSSDDEG